MKIVVKMSLIAGALLTANLAVAEDIAQSPVTTKCQSCHGLKGDSVSPSVPRLNGQQAAYVVTRLKDFLYPGSQEPHATAAMWDVVQQVDDATLASIAKYYASQTPTQALSAGPLASEGEKLYANGDLAEHVPACQQCHGINGEGGGSIPRLAGQHGEYLKNQLERLRLELRESDVMHSATNNLTDTQIEALVAYLARD